MQNLVNRFIQDESGATAIEYGLIAALIAVALIGGATKLGTAIDGKFNAAATSVSGASENTGT